MKFELESTNFDLGDTPIENIFIEDYMPVADGNFVKVFLLAYKYASSKDLPARFDNEVIARNLNLPISEVLSAWDYWESENVIEKTPNLNGDFNIKFVNLKQLYLNNSQRPKSNNNTMTQVDSFINEFQNEGTRKMFNNIDHIIRRQTYPNEKQEILSWLSEFNMSGELVEMAFHYTYEEKKINNMRYVKTVLTSWYDKGFTTREEVEEELEKSGEKYGRYSKVMSAIGIDHRNMSKADFYAINKWYDEYGYDDEIIEIACARSINAAKKSVGYVNAIIENWHKKGIVKVEDIEKLDIKPSSDKKITPKKTKFHNFKGASEKYSDKELDDIARKIRDKRTKRT
ncbi:MAG: DnaD domain protein [Tissierellia bacterium]|nr:DnaD domain protein [Tissierellia bacterium]